MKEAIDVEIAEQKIHLQSSINAIPEFASENRAE